MLRNLLFLLLFCAGHSFAFKFSPIVQEFKDKGKDKTKSFRLTNPSKEAIRVEAEAFIREIDIDNKETRTLTEDFVIYPSQIEIPAGNSQVIRLTYIGEKAKVEKPYRLIVRQIPNKLAQKKQKKTQINFLFEYVASLYVTPENAKAELVVNKAYKVNGNLIVEIENKGNKHILLRRYQLNLKQKNKSKKITFTKNSYEEFGNYNFLPGNKRKLVFKSFGELGVGKIEAKLKLQR